jgi:hypothetical protein
VKKGPNVFLTQKTLEIMKKRNTATGKRYRSLRNEVTRLVRRDKQDSNLLFLKEAKHNPQVLWGLADQVLGKDCHPFQCQSLAWTGIPQQPPWRPPRR